MKRFVLFLAAKFHRIAVFYIGSVLAASILLMWLEDKPFDLMMWYSCVTALTIGYGDVTAVTLSGRIVTMIFAHMWIFGVAPLIIANLLSTLMEDRDKFSHEEQEEIKRQLRNISMACDGHQLTPQSHSLLAEWLAAVGNQPCVEMFLKYPDLAHLYSKTTTFLQNREHKC